jgi:hypothetical protein
LLRGSAAWLQVATAIRGAIILAKMSVIPVRRGYWGNKIGKVHTVPTKVTGKCGSVTIRLIPAPRGAGTPLCTAALDWQLNWGCLQRGIGRSKHVTCLCTRVQAHVQQQGDVLCMVASAA